MGGLVHDRFTRRRDCSRPPLFAGSSSYLEILLSTFNNSVETDATWRHGGRRLFRGKKRKKKEKRIKACSHTRMEYETIAKQKRGGEELIIVPRDKWWGIGSNRCLRDWFTGFDFFFKSSIDFDRCFSFFVVTFLRWKLVQKCFFRNRETPLEKVSFDVSSGFEL